MNIRADAATIITTVILQKKSLDDVLPGLLPEYKMARDKGLLQELCYGTLRWYHRLDAITKTLLTQTSKKTDPLIYSLILVGLYQLIYLRIPPHAALSETVNATRIFQKPWAASLVNAVLRNFTRNQEKILAQLEANFVARYSHPEWFIKLLQKSMPKQWREVLEANNEYPPMHLRVNLQKNSRDAYLEKLTSANLNADKSPNTLTAITMEKPLDISMLPDFFQGSISVQDLAAQYAADLLELAPGLRVLDACAAPGGKTCHILEHTPALQELVAVDLTIKRLEMIRSNLTRLQLSATLVCGDAAKPDKWWDGKKFDRILLDAPCSGTGVIRRHPDIKILRRPEDIKSNATLQLKMLEALWPLLSDGGILVYATCSVLAQENQEVIEKFLRKYDNADEKSIAATWGYEVIHGRQIIPKNNDSDGFYYAKILKRFKS